MSESAGSVSPDGVGLHRPEYPFGNQKAQDALRHPVQAMPVIPEQAVGEPKSWTIDDELASRNRGVCDLRSPYIHLDREELLAMRGAQHNESHFVHAIRQLLAKAFDRTK